MRPLEFLLGLVTVSTALVSIVGRSKGTTNTLCAACIVTLGAHWIYEGPRLMAIPIYCAVCVLLVGQWSRIAWPLTSISPYLGLAGALTGLAACYMTPIFAFTKPPGPYAIGTHTFYFTDPNRAEQFADTPCRHRRFSAQMWYPAAPSDAPMAPYREPKALGWRNADLRYIKTNARLDAPAVQTQERFPVVFFSPSAGGYRSQNTYLTEFLVSYGYVVIGFDHPDSCARVPFPDGSVMKGLPDSWLNLDSRAALARSFIKSQKILEANVKDMQYVLDQLESGAASPQIDALAKHMDLSRVAAVGHSFGGAAAAEACRRDPRFRAGVNMDGWMFRPVTQYGIPRPFLFLIEDDPLWFKNEGPYPDNYDGMVRWGTLQYHESIRRDLARWNGHLATLRHGKHPDFSDMPLFERPWPWTARRPVSLKAIHEAVSKLVLAFLEDSLEARKNKLTSAETELQPFFRFGVSGSQSVLAKSDRQAIRSIWPRRQDHEQQDYQP